MTPLSDEEFENLVGDALDAVPDRLMAMVDNVAFFIEDEPDEDDPDLLGIYEGIPLTERAVDGWEFGGLPDRITLFRGPLTRCARSPEELRHEVTVTVVHEIAHHFGIDDDQLHALGWG